MRKTFLERWMAVGTVWKGSESALVDSGCVWEGNQWLLCEKEDTENEQMEEKGESYSEICGNYWRGLNNIKMRINTEKGSYTQHVDLYVAFSPFNSQYELSKYYALFV